MLGRYEDLKGAKAAIYKRKSQESDERQVLSLGKQAELCDEIVAEYQFDTSARWHFEEKKSAKTAGVRPQFNRMIALIQSGTIEVIVAWQFSRFVRNMQEGGLLIDLLHTGYLKAIVTKEKIFFPNDNTIIVAVEAATATEYSRNLSRSVIEGIDRKATLQLPHGRAPLGYLNNTHKRQGERDWRDDPKRLALVRQVMDHLLAGDQSAHSVWKGATRELKLTTPARQKTGGDLLSRAAFYRMLRRTEYAGFFFRNGDKIALAGVTPIITEDEYWQIQDLLGRAGVARPKSQISTYSHYLVSPDGEYCGADRTFRVTCDCTHTFSGQRRKECPNCGTPLDHLKRPRYYTAKHYYNVARKKRKEPCKYLNENTIDAYLLEYTFAHLTMPPHFKEWSRIYLRELKGKEEQLKEVTAKSNSDYIRSLEQQAQNAKRALLAGVFEPNEYKEALQDIQKRKKNAQNINSRGQWFEQASSLISFADNISYIWKHGSVSEKRTMLEKMGSNFVWDEERVCITNTKWLDAFVLGLKKAKGAKRLSELDEDGEIPNGSNKDLEELAKSDPAFPILCGMWDDVRTEILANGQ